ncbi:hypothetical protein Q5424_15355 [Conexibacter sp. JD483]|uniref:hypothetical protein n=1 Tax=unclassified Conexibacter TaxID=2627773 RepID=UPI00271DA764|nr:MULTISPECIES: hypothetical protein [unclassified Conexibacter]MDO8186785.1 hypothetical protein [Conexibacter sp. CPCC 205706]MDO8197461.1 hypothetical protein [Conexibacter sp. CPCC 205762]MDR9370476.1 hypothetical protein [Conexibacter sp. JD483]
MPRLLALLALATTVAAALLTASAATGSAASAPACRNLAVPSGLRAALTRAHDHPRDGAIGRGSLYYGSCGGTRYAIASFSKALADQPEKFRKLPGKAWRDMGDGFEDGCAAGPRWPIPKPLVRLWGTCKR